MTPKQAQLMALMFLIHFMALVMSISVASDGGGGSELEERGPDAPGTYLTDTESQTPEETHKSPKILHQRPQ